jgi:hypothetical protein
MPYAKVLKIASEQSLSGKLFYIANATHVNHICKTVESASFYHVQNAAQFLAKTVSAIRDINARRKHGRKTRNLAEEIIIRMPDFSNLTDEERSIFVKTTLSDFCPDSPAVAAWHIDKYNGSCDVHIIVANFEQVYPLKTRRSSTYNPIAVVRATSDRITTILNARRLQNGIVPIVTMSEVRKRNLKQRGLATLAEQLAPMLPFSAANLREKIKALGHEVTRFNPAKNSISVCFAGSKKAHRFFLDRLLVDAACLGGGLPPTGVIDIASSYSDMTLS